MWRTSLVIFMLVPIGCADASEPTCDSSNPVNCLVIFGVAANGAKQVSQPAVADEMVRRASLLAEQHGGLSWINKVTPQSMDIGKKIEAAHDQRATQKLLDECVAQQDATSGSSTKTSQQQ